MCCRTPGALQEEKEFMEKIKEAEKTKDLLCGIAEEWKRSVDVFVPLGRLNSQSE